MTIDFNVNTHGPNGAQREYWAGTANVPVEIKVTNTGGTPFVFRIVLGYGPGGLQQVRQTLFAGGVFGFTGEAVQFLAGGSAASDSVPDNNASTGTVEINVL